MLISAMLIKNMYINRFVALHRLQATAVNCALELINEDSGTKEGTAKIRRPGGCNNIKKEVLALVFSCEFCKISKNTFFAEHLWMTASNFICHVLFIFSIIINFRHEKSRLVENRLNYLEFPQ